MGLADTFRIGCAGNRLLSPIARGDDDRAQSTQRRSRNDLRSGLLLHKRSVATMIGLTAGGSLAFYTFTTYMQKYLVNSSGMSAKTARGLMTVALVAYLLTQPAFGTLSDRIGRKRSMILFRVLSTLGTVPLLDTLSTVTNPGVHPDRRRACRAEPVHVDQRSNQGRVVSDGRARAGCLTALRACQRRVRWIG